MNPKTSGGTHLLRFVLDDGESIVASCEAESLQPATRDLPLVLLPEPAPSSPFVTFVSDTKVERIPSERVEAILSVETDVELPEEVSVFHFALIA